MVQGSRRSILVHPANAESGATSGYNGAAGIFVKRDIVGLLERFSCPWIIKCACVFVAQTRCERGPFGS